MYNLNSRRGDKRTLGDVAAATVGYICSERHENKVYTASAGPNSYVLVEEQGDDIRDKERLADRDREQADTAIRDARLFRPTRCARLIFASTAARAWRFSA